MTKNFKRRIGLVVMFVLMILLVESAELICDEIILEFIEDWFDWDYTIDIEDWTYLVAGIIMEWTIVTKLFSIGNKFYALFNRKEDKKS